MRHPLFRPRPSVVQLWRGCILCTIAEGIHSAWTGTGGIGGWFSWWEGGCYLLDDRSGDLGALAFNDDRVVGIFFAHDSNRSPWSQDREVHDIDWYFRGMPSHLRLWADEEIIPHMARWGSPGDPPIITAALWGEGNVITSVDSWPDLFWHGLAILHTELQPPDAAIRTLRDQYDLSTMQVTLLESLFNRRVAEATKALSLTDQERALLVADRPTELPEWQRQRLTGGSDDAGITLCRDLLAQIDMIVP
jgi:hypothetical protein